MDINFFNPWFSLVLVAIALLAFWCLRARRITGLARIIDGDSLEVNGQRVRLAGIDAPEYDQFFTRRGKVRQIGSQSRQALSDLLANRPVVCKVLGKDIYNRKLVVCYNHQGEDVAKALVLMGLAEVYRNERGLRSVSYRFNQLRARFSRRGLWETGGNSPQAWRQSRS